MSARRPAQGGSLPTGAAPDIMMSCFSSEVWSREAGSVPAEMALTIYVNNEELATMLCTPSKLTALVLGFLYSEGVIDSKDDVASMRVCEEEWLADVRLSRGEYTPPQRRTLTTGCSGGVSLTPELKRVDSALRVRPEEISSLMKQLNERAELYRSVGGVHTSALAEPGGPLVVAEDIGRHNTLDKIMGECLLTGISTGDKLLLMTGRVSSEMLSKALRMQTPIVVSRSSPTDRAVSLARELGITLVGYARGSRLSVYSHEERVEGALN